MFMRLPIAVVAISIALSFIPLPASALTITFEDVAQVPLPGSLTLLLGALGGLAYINRRRRTRSGD